MALREHRAKQRAARNEREKAMLLAVLSYEIRSPMGVIIASVELLQKNLHEPATKDILATVGTASESLLNLLNELLDFSKLGARRLELVTAPYDLSLLVQNAVDLSTHKAQVKGLTIYNKIIAPPQCNVVIDAARVRQILVNLLSNAIKFSDDDAIYIMATFKISDGTNGMLSVSLVDNGIGISSEAQKYLFQPFSQAQGAEAHPSPNSPRREIGFPLSQE